MLNLASEAERSFRAGAVCIDREDSAGCWGVELRRSRLPLL
jgi:hypothetical protein